MHNKSLFSSKWYTTERVLIIVSVSEISCSLGPFIIMYRNIAVGAHSKNRSLAGYCTAHMSYIWQLSQISLCLLVHAYVKPLYKSFCFLHVSRVYKSPNRNFCVLNYRKNDPTFWFSLKESILFFFPHELIKGRYCTSHVPLNIPPFFPPFFYIVFPLNKGEPECGMAQYLCFCLQYCHPVVNT